MKTRKYRDLTVIDINADQLLVVACDSAGGIGNKENDVVQTPPEVVGEFTAQVALMEILAFGAQPITVVDTLSVEMEDTGRRVLKGIEKALEPLDLDLDNIITGSTEENIPVTVTGIGVTVIGIINKNNWKKPKTSKGQVAVVIGLPKMGNEILEDQGSIMDIEKLLKLKDNDAIEEILPVGSKGIFAELEQMAHTNNLDFTLDKELSIEIDLKKSAGPSACVIASMDEKSYKNLEKNFPIPVNKIARFI